MSTVVKRITEMADLWKFFAGNIILYLFYTYNAIIIPNSVYLFVNRSAYVFSGKHSNIIVPPSWIVKLPRKGNFKSSIRSPKKRSSKKKTKDKVRI